MSGDEINQLADNAKELVRNATPVCVSRKQALDAISDLRDAALFASPSAPAASSEDARDAARWRMIRDGDPSIAIELVGGSAFSVGWDAYVDAAIAAAKESR